MICLVIRTVWAGNDYQVLIEKGEFTKAEKVIRQELMNDTALDASQKRALEFELERMRRIRLDFSQSQTEVIEFIRQYIPDATASDLARWEAAKSLEWMLINGEKKYFNEAAANLFRLDNTTRSIKQKADAMKPTEVRPADGFDLNVHCQNVMEVVNKTKKSQVLPVRMKIAQSITVHPNVVPPGKIIRCWIPFPREVANRQMNIRILNTEPPVYVLANTDQSLQRTVYFEKPAVRDSTTRFSVKYTYEIYGTYTPIQAAKVIAVKPTPEMESFLREEPPHIVFSAEIRELSRQIIGTEKNPYRAAQKLFQWMNTHVPWAAAREYSTIYNIPDYVLNNRHGDCGMMVLTFITLCRLNGIPARWQSGWEFKPPHDSMHDWGEVYFAPYGWVPMDVTYGIRLTSDESFKWFYLSGMDSYRTIFNDGMSADFYPLKVYPRSEIIDSQRGEVEWEGGNLYFDQWDWEHDWEILSNP